MRDDLQDIRKRLDEVITEQRWIMVRGDDTDLLFGPMPKREAVRLGTWINEIAKPEFADHVSLWWPDDEEDE